jgi:AcrR family transcriptional regulator
VYRGGVPKLWTDTIDAHRTAVREAALNAVQALVTDHGLIAVTMSQIAERAGIGRATLYKYFPDLQALLLAWHERQITDHLGQLTAAADPADPPAARLEAVLLTYALTQRQTRSAHTGDLSALLHRGEHVTRAERQLYDFLQELIAQGAQAGEIRSDVAAEELAGYCLHALSAAAGMPSTEAVHRLVAVAMTGLYTHSN